MLLQLHLDAKGWLCSFKHRRVHCNTVLCCEPEKNGNSVVWIFLPWRRHLLWVLCECCFCMTDNGTQGEYWVNLFSFCRSRMTSVSQQTPGAVGWGSQRTTGASTRFVPVRHQHLHHICWLLVVICWKGLILKVLVCSLCAGRAEKRQQCAVLEN